MNANQIKHILATLHHATQYDDGLLRIEMDLSVRRIDVYLAGYFVVSCSTKAELARWLVDLPD